MPITDAELAEAVTTLRPALLSSARKWRTCNHDDAEDLVEETVFYALNNLDKYTDSQKPNSLLRWLRGFLRFVVDQDRRRSSRRPITIPIEDLPETGASQNPPGPVTADHVAATLPVHLRSLVRDWLAGYSQSETAHRHNLHRTTVAIHLEQAFRLMGKRLPRENDLTISKATEHLTDWAGITIYHKPHGVWPDWTNQHPPDIVYFIYPDYVRWSTVQNHRRTSTRLPDDPDRSLLHPAPARLVRLPSRRPRPSRKGA